MKEINGFTFIEMLFSIVILSSLLLLAVPSMMEIIKNQETEQFFNVLDADLVFIQSQSFGKRNNARIIFAEDYYVVLYDNQKEEIKRHFPKHLSPNVSINHRISFNINGTINNPGSFLIKDRDKTYKVVFPLGKGRHYIEEF